MAKILIAFGGKPTKGYSVHYERDWDAEVGRLFESAKPFGLETRKYDPEYIYATKYYKLHENIFDLPHMGWLFKPFIFHEALNSVPNGDYVLYMDSNETLVKSPQIVFDVAEAEDMFCHYHAERQFPNKYWCRRDTFVGMELDSQEYWDEPQTQANIICMKKCGWIMDFVEEWMKYCADPIILGFNSHASSELGKPNFEGFKANRWEQSIFSLLRQAYEVPAQNHAMIYDEVYQPAKGKE